MNRWAGVVPPRWSLLGCSDLCQPNPVRDALAKVSMKELESAIGTARQRSANADGTQTADLFNRIADDMEAELYDRLLTIATGNVLRESREETRRAVSLIQQMTS